MCQWAVWDHRGAEVGRRRGRLGAVYAPPCPRRPRPFEGPLWGPSPARRRAAAVDAPAGQVSPGSSPAPQVAHQPLGAKKGRSALVAPTWGRTSVASHPRLGLASVGRRAPMASGAVSRDFGEGLRRGAFFKRPCRVTEGPPSCSHCRGSVRAGRRAVRFEGPFQRSASSGRSQETLSRGIRFERPSRRGGFGEPCRGAVSRVGKGPSRGDPLGGAVKEGPQQGPPSGRPREGHLGGRFRGTVR
ncbi:hypothetical protein M885DRAFT_525928 [Pelagophyceae sp. CCMP2097]|nr:hypothetical protein M885DRAFT_525928 [Pelagophyceae sp. CCMP2097]